jgi:hypothetical protein
MGRINIVEDQIYIVLAEGYQLNGDTSIRVLAAFKDRKKAREYADRQKKHTEWQKTRVVGRILQ